MEHRRSRATVHESMAGANRRRSGERQERVPWQVRFAPHKPESKLRTGRGHGDPCLPSQTEKVASSRRRFFVSAVYTLMDLAAAPYGGARYPVEARLDRRIFTRFHLDAGIG